MFANVDRPHGAIPLYRLGGGNISVAYYDLIATNAILGIGDFVELLATGDIDRAEASDVQICGVIAVAKAANAGSGPDGTLNQKVPVYDAADIVYVMQDNNSTDGVAAADMGNNANFVVADAVNGISQMEIDEASIATTNTLPLKLLRLYRHPDNAFGANARIEVLLQNHVYSGNLAGI